MKLKKFFKEYLDNMENIGSKLSNRLKKSFKNIKLLTWLIIIIPATFCFALITYNICKWPSIQKYDFMLLDMVMNIKDGLPPYENILLVNIDKNTIDKMPEIPIFGPEWRKYHATVLRNLKTAKVIAFDILFNRATIHDKTMTDSIGADTAVVIGTSENSEIPPLILSKTKGGFLEYYPDVDYKFRRFHLVRTILKKRKVDESDRIIRGFYYNPSFIFRIIQNYYCVSCIEKNNEIYGLIEDSNIVRIGSAREVPVDGDNFVYIRNIKKGNNFHQISYFDIYKGNFDPVIINNKIVIIGSDYVDNKDFKLTPFGQISGLLLNALALNTILQKGYLNHYNSISLFSLIYFFGLFYAVAFLFKATRIIILAFLISISFSICSTFSMYYLPLTPLVLIFVLTFLFLFIPFDFEYINQIDKKIKKIFVTIVICFIFIIPYFIFTKDSSIFVSFFISLLASTTPELFIKE